MGAGRIFRRAVIVLGVSGLGCSEAPVPNPSTQNGAPVPAPSTVATEASEASHAAQALPAISLAGPEETREMNPVSGSAAGEQRGRRMQIERLQPLQVMLGTWKGTTQREFGDFKALDEPVWVWDFQTDADHPALVMTSQSSPYFRAMRLSYRAAQDDFVLSIQDPEGRSRTLTGQFTQPVEEFQGDDKRLHRRYKLELTEHAPADDGDAWQVLFNQQENNRYLVELSRRRGPRFMRFDTIAHQRAGTSFALDDADYGEQACIITGGLGTSTIAYKGKTYWVCCSGCRAAFEENPEKWIAAAAELRTD